MSNVMEELEFNMFVEDLERLGVPAPVREHKFLMTRRFRFDFAWPKDMVALEVEGGVWIGGRHTRGKGFLMDMEKYNLAVIDGWRLVRCTPDQYRNGEAVILMAKVFGRSTMEIASYDLSR